MNHTNKVFVAFFLLFTMFAFTGFAHAQTVSMASSSTSVGVGSFISPPASSGPICFVFPENLYLGESDTASWSGVTQLQDFLVQKGYFNSAYLGTGHFGPLTLRAVEQFQAANGIPATGYVGILTRAEINDHCNDVTLGGSTTSTSTVATSVNAPTIISLNPSSAAVGTQVTIYGTNFGSSNTVLLNGNSGSGTQDITPIVIPVSAMDCTNTLCNGASGGVEREMITFTIPQVLTPVCTGREACPMYAMLVTSGQFTVTVQDTNGTSNSLPLTVTGGGITPTTNTASST